MSKNKTPEERKRESAEIFAEIQERRRRRGLAPIDTTKEMRRYGMTDATAITRGANKNDKQLAEMREAANKKLRF